MPRISNVTSTLLLAGTLLSPMAASATDALFVDTTGFVGIGTNLPDSNLHVYNNNTAIGSRSLLRLSNNGPIGFNMENRADGLTWRFAAQTTGFRISLDGSGGREFEVGNDGSMIVGPGGVVNMALNSTGDLTITGTLSQGSSKHWKTDIKTVDPDTILQKVANLPIAEWRYAKDTDGVTHLGPMAEDFADAFGLGRDRTHIATGDMAGVALAGLQAVATELDRKDREIARLRTELEASEGQRQQAITKLESDNARLSSRLAAIEQMLATVQHAGDLALLTE